MSGLDRRSVQIIVIAMVASSCWLLAVLFAWYVTTEAPVSSDGHGQVTTHEVQQGR